MSMPTIRRPSMSAVFILATVGLATPIAALASRTTDSLTLKPLNGAPAPHNTSTGQRQALLYAIPALVLLLAGATFAYARRRRRYGNI